MSNGRNAGKKPTGRDAGGFIALPWAVLDCPAYAGLSHPARSLLLEVARQYVRDNNGRLLLSAAYMKSRGWNSVGVIQKAKIELLKARFIFETVKGKRPNKAGWYAVAWQTIDRLPGYDAGAVDAFERGAYRAAPARPKRTAPTCRNPKKNALPIPSHGIGEPLIVPSDGIERPDAIPCDRTMRGHFDAPSIPSDGNHLEKPSADVARLGAQPHSASTARSSLTRTLIARVKRDQRNLQPAN